MRSPLITRLIDIAFEEDAPSGDITSELLINEKLKGRGEFIVKEKGVIAGLFLLELIFHRLDPKAKITLLKHDGDLIKPGTVVARVESTARVLLRGERVALNFLQRLSGIATKTRIVMKSADGLVILDTRKTTPGLRNLEKYAVSVGGATNHRGSLSDAILVKNNHVDLVPGGMRKVVQKLTSSEIPFRPVIIEVRNQKELKEALKAFPTGIMLDNMTDSEIKKSVKLIRKKAPVVFVEVSGGVTPLRFRSIRSAGADGASLGNLTSEFKSLDISFRIRKRT